MQYDAVNVGEFDLSLGIDALLRLQERASFPLVSSNLLDNNTYQLLFKPYVVRRIKACRIGIFGLLSSRPIQNNAGVFVQDPFVTARHMVEELKSKAEFIVCLSNLGLMEDKRLCETVPGIHVIIESGTGALLSQPMVENKTLLLQAYQKGEYLGILEVQAMPPVNEGLEPKQYRHTVVALDQKYPEDPEISTMVAAFKSSHKPSPGLPFPPLR